MSKQNAGVTPATIALTRAGIPFTVHRYEHDPSAASYGQEAADVMGIDADRVFKTLFVGVDGALAVCVVPVSRQLDLKAAAAALGGKKATMADPADAERASGYVVGGISPIGQKRAHRTAVDESADRWPTVFVSGGRRGLEIELAPADLTRVTRATTAALAR